MHRGNPSAHQATPTKYTQWREARAADYKESYKRCKNGGQQGQYHSGNVVIDLHGETESQHARIVHGPDASTHGNGAANQPNASNLLTRGGHSSGQMQRGISSENGNQN